MPEEITNRVLLEHMQAMKYDLQQQITGIKGEIVGIKSEVIGIKGELRDLRSDMNKGFDEARKHRQELQQDMDATINMLMKHDKKLAHQ
jgi:hypothetical protein